MTFPMSANASKGIIIIRHSNSVRSAINSAPVVLGIHMTPVTNAILHLLILNILLPIHHASANQDMAIIAHPSHALSATHYVTNVQPPLIIAAQHVKQPKGL